MTPVGKTINSYGTAEDSSLFSTLGKTVIETASFQIAAKFCEKKVREI
jgi:hypothetical protein